MPSIINASSTGTGGIVQTADASGVLQLQSNGTTAVNIDASANVGIGTTSPSVKLTVVGNIKAGYEAATGLILGIAASVPTNDVNAYVLWGTDSVFGGNNGDLVYVPRTSAAGIHRFYTGNGGAATEKVKITNAGVLDLATGAGAVGQIQFPATQVASSNANTLDDYEEGTWTPSLGGTATYSAQSGTYTKIGRQVIANFDIIVNTIGTGSTTQVSGLPFTSTTGGGADGMGGAVGYLGAIATPVVSAYARTDRNTTSFYIWSMTAAQSTLTSSAIFGNSARATGTVTYITL